VVTWRVLCVCVCVCVSVCVRVRVLCVHSVRGERRRVSDECALLVMMCH